MRYYLNFTIAGLSLIGGIVACVNALVTGTNWELVVLAAVFFSFSSGNITLLEIRDAVRAAAERERIKDEALGDAEPIVLRVGPEHFEDDAPRLPRQAQM
ncbi:MAG: hypothetical protein MI757_05470 [Pirellulales bacterium]|nr:hypothetical protein [Pirellulales bacterium]